MTTIDDYKKVLIALFLGLVIVGMELVTVNRVDSLSAALIGLMFGVLTTISAALFTEVLYDGTLEEENLP